MRINNQIKTTFSEIARESVKFHNDPQRHTKYLRRITRVYQDHLSEEEKVFVMSTLMELLHYRNLSVDPDNMLTINNIRLRTLFMVFIGTIVMMLVAAALFKTNSSISHLIGMMGGFFKMFRL